MSIEPAPAAARYITLDALRGTAAFAVLFYHLRTIDAPDRPAEMLSMFASGYLAVDLFFLLSGFVIAHAYEERLKGAMSFRAFMIARFIRLQPVIAIGTLIGFALALTQRVLMLEDAPGFMSITTSLPVNLLLLPNFLVPWAPFLLNPPAWSLFYEILANGCYAIILRFAASRPRLRIKAALMLIWLAGLLGLGVSAFHLGSIDYGVALEDWPIAICRITFSFIAGLWLYKTRESWSPRIPRVAAPWLLLACLALLAINPAAPFRPIYDLGFVTIFSPALVAAAAVAKPTPYLNGLGGWLGLISYPLYAVHAPVKHVLEACLSLSFIPLLMCTVVITVCLSWLIAAYIEPVLRKMLSNTIKHLMAEHTSMPFSPSRLADEA